MIIIKSKQQLCSIKTEKSDLFTTLFSRLFSLCLLRQLFSCILANLIEKFINVFKLIFNKKFKCIYHLLSKNSTLFKIFIAFVPLEKQFSVQYSSRSFCENYFSRRSEHMQCFNNVFLTDKRAGLYHSTVRVFIIHLHSISFPQCLKISLIIYVCYYKKLTLSVTNCYNFKHVFYT